MPASDFGFCAQHVRHQLVLDECSGERFDKPELTEIVEDRGTGLLVDPRRPDALAVALETVLTNTKLSEEFGRAAARRVEAFGLESVARRFLEALP